VLATNQGRVYIVHGFNSTGDKWDHVVQSLKDQGLDAEDFDYGWRWLISVWFASRVAAVGLASVSRAQDYVIGYSNGCAVVMHALERGAKFKKVILVAPALRNDLTKPWPRRPWSWPSTLEEIHVLHDKSDYVVEAAHWLLRPTIWGNMGRVGYKGDLPYVYNWPRITVNRTPWAAHLSWGDHPEAFAALVATIFDAKRDPHVPLQGAD